MDRSRETCSWSIIFDLVVLVIQNHLLQINLEYVSIISPSTNYFHFFSATMAVAIGMNMICESPLF